MRRRRSHRRGEEPSFGEPEAEADQEAGPPAAGELERRLRNLEWPTPPAGAKERVLARLAARFEELDVETEQLAGEQRDDERGEREGGAETAEDAPSSSADRL